MRATYSMIGIGILILVTGASYAFNTRFTKVADTGEQRADMATLSMAVPLTLKSSAFEEGGNIPEKFTCDVEGEVSPQLSIEGVPAETKSLALIMDDPDVTSGSFVHWVLFNIPPEMTKLQEGTAAGVAGKNSWGRSEYGGPCPPSEHRYYFKLYALDTMLDLMTGATKAEVEQAMEGHILAETQLMGRYERK